MTDPWNSAIEAAAAVVDLLTEDYDEREWVVSRIRALARPPEPPREEALEAEIERLQRVITKQHHIIAALNGGQQPPEGVDGDDHAD